MIALRPMRADEFAIYAEYFVADYATEIADNFGLSEEAALRQAGRSIARDLPDGTDTPDQSLVCIIDEKVGDDPIGYLCYRPDDEAHTAFISDFYILPEYQNQGHGRAALALLEASLAEAGYKQLQLRVAADNQRARHVYRMSGFQTTGFNMNKHIG
ncbi:MAG: GNAT family N-acetyltransferase [Alphaproteobacteria bacterium]